MAKSSDEMPRSKSEYVAQRLLDRIITDNLDSGSYLGTEAELLQQFNVSRPTLRESLRILETQGVIELRPGPGGGIMITRPGTDIVAHGLSVYLRVHGIPDTTMHRALNALQPALIAQAAEMGSADDFDALDAVVEKMRLISDPRELRQELRHFYLLIARATQNQVLDIFWSTLDKLSGGPASTLEGEKITAADRQRIVALHGEMVSACRAKDPSTASALLNALLSAPSPSQTQSRRRQARSEA
ncbi:FadR/GntR family transcriptional regulator [Paracoccus pantotrophus]|uniref:FadR/GntR family transcriptional regulator n=1 Tax=Paracoccus pantotrophus TaxID=82367 RepID=UPI001E520FC1|nr:FCD domain-containing protein [Paracoccus pantotrophus]